MQVVKSTGEKEEFDRSKLVISLDRAGASEEVRNNIVAHIEAELVDGMTTREIYQHAHDILSKKQTEVAVKYSIRKAVLELGPSGFPFEQLIAELYRRDGYTVITDEYVNGKCAEHEVDIIAYKGKELIMMEAKFHNQEGVKTDLKIALYVKARVDDLAAATFDYGEATKLTHGILVTNTKFTHTAKNYASCSGLELIGWNYPHHGNLQDMIEKQGLHPVTCLNTLSKRDKKELLEKDIILLRSLQENLDVLDTIGIDKEKKKHVLKEIKSIVK